MKQHILFLLIIGFSISQNPVSFENAKKHIKKSTENAVRYWNEGDLDKHLEHYDKNFTYMSGGGSKKGIDNFKRALNYYFKDGKSGYYLELVNFELKELAEGLILETGTYHLTKNDKKTNGWYSVIWKYKDKKWKVIFEASK